MALTFTGTPVRQGSGRYPSRLDRSQVSELQRSRVIAALAEVVEELGYGGLTVSAVIARARVSRKTFYDLFADREEGFLATFQQASDRARAMLGDAYAQESDWCEGVRSALGVLLALMDQEPGLARLCVIDALAAGERVLCYRAQALDELAWMLDQGRYVGPAEHDPPALTAEALVGGILAIMHARLMQQDGPPLITLLGPLMSMIALPYLGLGSARQELQAACPEPTRPNRRRPKPRPDPDPLQGVKIRLTYRTVRVLMVIGSSPDLSNCQVAERAGILDQGQISKLLHRLARLELIENVGKGQPKGACNAWRLTAKGTRVESAARPPLRRERLT